MKLENESLKMIQMNSFMKRKLSHRSRDAMEKAERASLQVSEISRKGQSCECCRQKGAASTKTQRQKTGTFWEMKNFRMNTITNVRDIGHMRDRKSKPGYPPRVTSNRLRGIEGF